MCVSVGTNASRENAVLVDAAWADYKLELTAVSLVIENAPLVLALTATHRPSAHSTETRPHHVLRISSCTPGVGRASAMSKAPGGEAGRWEALAKKGGGAAFCGRFRTIRGDHVEAHYSTETLLAC